jgi:hypothetical protein|tara:strand:- start:9820 stop:11256 length:1437 start_codon:yes stop_codon:yes gene_type:complete
MRLLLSLLISLLILSPSNSEEATSGNLLPNAGTGRTSYQNSSGSIDGITSSTGWTMSGSQYLTNEIEIEGTGTISANGSLLNLNTTKATDGASFTTTADSLDGGVRLNSTTEVQNCEWSGSQWRCGQSGAGRDSYSTTVKILDDTGTVLNSVTQNRNTDAGYYGNTFTYTDTVIHNSTGARNWSWEFSGLDGDSPNSTSLVGPNLLGAELTATLLDIQYSALPTTTQNELQTFKESTLKEFAKIEENLKVEEKFKMEEPKFTYEEPTFRAPEKFETYESPQLKEEASTEVFQETSPFIKEEEKGSPQEQAPRFVEEDPQEPQNVEEEPSSLRAAQKSNEEASTETETQTEKEQTTEAVADSKGNVSGEKKAVSLVKSMKKIDQQVKDIGKNLQLKNLVKLKIMSNNDVLQEYANTQFYKPKDIYKDQVDIRDNRILYANSTLVSYTQNDPIFTKEQELYNIRLEKQKLINEIKALTNG